MMKRFIAPALTLVLLAGVGIAAFKSNSETQNSAEADTQANGITEIKGAIDSTKEAFFKDPETIAAFDKIGKKVTVTKLGSREIATTANLASQYDFVFPAGASAAEKIKRDQGLKNSTQPFATPMVIASWRPIADILMANGIVSKRGETYYIVDMAGLFNLIAQEKRWSDLKKHEAYPVGKSILISTTDPKTSNSAAMYLAQASYVLNNNDIVQSTAQVDSLLPKLTALFARQGYTESSTEVPFQDYLIPGVGMGKSPLVMIYEAQFLREQIKGANSPIRPEMVMLYPEPTLFAKHVLISTNKKGDELADALNNNKDLQRIAVKHGFRTANMGEFLAENKMTMPPELINVIDPPSYEVLEDMISKVIGK